MGLAAIRTGIANALRTIVGLRVYDFPSDRVETPAAVLSMPETPYDVTLGGRSDEWTFPLWILVAKADDRASYVEMTDYLDSTGSKSIRAVLETDRTLGGSCDTVAVINARPLFATVAGTEYLAIEFTVEAYGLGSPTPPGPTWTPLVLQNGYVQSGTVVPALYKDGFGTVHLRGKITGGTPATVGFDVGAGNGITTGIQFFNWQGRPNAAYISGTVVAVGQGPGGLSSDIIDLSTMAWSTL